MREKKKRESVNAIISVNIGRMMARFREKRCRSIKNKSHVHAIIMPNVKIFTPRNSREGYMERS